jgi:hypothetical protein
MDFVSRQAINDPDWFSNPALTLVLAGNINMGAEAFHPIGRTGNTMVPFNGDFNGAGYTITGLRNNSPGAQNVGLFGEIGMDGKVHNLNLDGVYITGGMSVGAVASVNRGLIENVSVSKDNITATIAVGGFVGQNFGMIRNSSLVGDRSSNPVSGSTVSGTSWVGGIAGANSGTIEDCMAVDAKIEGRSNVGGIAGLNYSEIRRCFNSSDVTGTGDGTSNIGGIAGHNTRDLTRSGSVSYSENRGNISGVFAVGGVIGRHDSGVTLRYLGSGPGVTITGNTPYNLQHLMNVQPSGTGGIIGTMGGNSTLEYSYSLSNMEGNAFLGGLVGSTFGAGVEMQIIRHSYHAVGNLSTIDTAVNPGGVFGTFITPLTVHNVASMTTSWFTNSYFGDATAITNHTNFTARTAYGGPIVVGYAASSQQTIEWWRTNIFGTEGNNWQLQTIPGHGSFPLPTAANRPPRPPGVTP